MCGAALSREFGEIHEICHSGSEEKKTKFYRNLSHTVRNYGLEIFYGSHSKLLPTPNYWQHSVHVIVCKSVSVKEARPGFNCNLGRTGVETSEEKRIDLKKEWKGREGKRREENTRAEERGETNIIEKKKREENIGISALFYYSKPVRIECL